MIQISQTTLDSLPEFLNSQQLVQLGLFPSLDAAYVARVRGHSPDFIKLKRKILYPKKAVAQFIAEHVRSGSSPIIKCHCSSSEVMD